LAGSALSQPIHNFTYRSEEHPLRRRTSCSRTCRQSVYTDHHLRHPLVPTPRSCAGAPTWKSGPSGLRNQALHEGALAPFLEKEANQNTPPATRKKLLQRRSSCTGAPTWKSGPSGPRNPALHEGALAPVLEKEANQNTPPATRKKLLQRRSSCAGAPTWKSGPSGPRNSALHEGALAPVLEKEA
jgi:hypothetical protein